MSTEPHDSLVHETSARTEPGRDTGLRRTILVVDDALENRQFLTTLLGYVGHRMLEASDGEEALRLARAERPDVIIADILMPTMDGYEFVRQLRSDPTVAQTKVIFHSAAYEDREVRPLAELCGVSLILPKPASPDDVLGAVGQALGAVQVPVRPPTEDFDREHLRLLMNKLSEKAAALEAANRHLTAANAELEQRVADRTAELTRSNADLEQFAFVAAHDLQEPLRIVIGFTQLLAQEYQGKLGPDADEFIGYAVDGAKRMQQLIRDLLTYARAGKENKLVLTDCESVVTVALADLQPAIEESGATIHREPLPSLQADPLQLAQVFQNLISNALKYRDLRASQQTEIWVRAERQGPEWVFSLRDNGIGIDLQYAARIFLIFQRLHSIAEYPGTGIGLAICKRIVERHGGRIWVESVLGRGATFYFTIPA